MSEFPENIELSMAQKLEMTRQAVPKGSAVGYAGLDNRNKQELYDYQPEPFSSSTEIIESNDFSDDQPEEADVGGAGSDNTPFRASKNADATGFKVNGGYYSEGNNEMFLVGQENLVGQYLYLTATLDANSDLLSVELRAEPTVIDEYELDVGSSFIEKTNTLLAAIFQGVVSVYRDGNVEYIYGFEAGQLCKVPIFKGGTL